MNDKTKLAVKDDKMMSDQAREDLARFVASKGGKVWVRNIARHSMVMVQGIFTGNSTTFYNEGKRDVALSILKDVQAADPEAYASIIQGIEL